MSPVEGTLMPDPEAQHGSSRPASLQARAHDLERMSLLAAALLVGLGIIMWVAGNWDGLGRYGRFAVTGLALVGTVAGGLLLPQLRAPFLLMAHLAVGGLLAQIGQTYQTGADPWSLFAIWAGMTLAFALAARSDALWSAWVIVAMAGVALWSHNQGQAFFGLPPDPRRVLLAWAVNIGLCLPISPWSPVRQVVGGTRWSWRIGVALALYQVVLPSIAALFHKGSVTLFFVGLALCGGLLLLVAKRRPFDLVIAALLGLAIDALLIAALVRLVFSNRGTEIGGSLIVGLAAAGIVASTATWLLRHYRKHMPAVAAPETMTATPAEPPTPPWPILALTAFGALFAAVPLLAFYALTLVQLVGDDALSGPLLPALGALTLGAVVIRLRTGKPGLFVNVLALIFALVGVLQIGFGAFRDLPLAMAAMAMLVLLLALALIVPQRWIGLLAGLPASMLLGLAILSLMLPRSMAVWHALMRPDAVSMPAVMKSLIIVAIVTFVVRPIPLLARLSPFFIGWIVGALVVLAWGSGPTLLAGAFGVGFPVGGQGTGSLMPIERAVLVGIASLGVVWIGTSRPEWRTPVLMLNGLGLLVLVALIPALAIPTFVGLVMLTEGRRGLALLAGAVGLWIIGAFYYSLVWPLVTKGLVLIGLGSVLIGLSAVLGRTRLGAGLFNPAVAIVSPGLAGRSAQVLIASSAMFIIGLCGWSILSKEHVLRTGRMVLVRIVPVDPRSLVQGDYMTLAFELPQRRPSTAAKAFGAPQPVAIGQVGADNVVTFTEIVPKRPSLAPDTVAMALNIKNGAFVVGSDAWFFKEGTADKWASARYGIFRVTSDGTALLAGLADEARRPIQ